MTSPRVAQGLELSVIVPSHNRRAGLSALLEAFEKQTLASDRYEVIIVLDGSTDGSEQLIAAWAHAHPAFNMRAINQRNQGQSAARTNGAAQALGPVLLFLDDDVVPGPACLAAHVRHHYESDQPIVVLGDARMPERPRESYYDLLTRMWWDDMHAERAARFPYVIYRDFCSSHVSMPQSLFAEAGGFDPDFQGYGGEDYDLGYRLLKADVPFVLAPDAAARHDHRGSTRQVLRNLLDEGRNDVRLGAKHPELRTSLRCASPGPAARVIFLAPWLFRQTLRVGVLALSVCERAGLWSAWRWLFGKLRYMAYWLGVARGSGRWAAHRAFLAAAPPPPCAQLDITDGLPADLAEIWRQGKSRVVLRAHGEPRGEIELPAPPVGPLPAFLADAIIRRPDISIAGPTGEPPSRTSHDPPSCAAAS